MALPVISSIPTTAAETARMRISASTPTEERKRLLEEARRAQAAFTQQVMPSETSVGAIKENKPTGPTQLQQRQGIAAGLRKLSKSGGLTQDLMEEAKQRASEAGVTDEQFSSFMGREGISVSKTPEEAAQNVMLQREFGSGLGTFQAMQDPAYEVGSGSSLRQPAQQLGTQSGAMRRAARRLRRQGYSGAAQQMAMQAEQQRLGEPTVMTPELRAQQMGQRIAAGKMAMQEQDYNQRLMGYLNRLLEKETAKL